eukprot:2663599-Rhodomonas_salina.1
MDIQGGEWAIKDVMFCPMRTCAMRIKTDGNVSMYNCLVRGIPPDHPAADGIVCLNRAKLVMEECTFQFVGECVDAGRLRAYCAARVLRLWCVRCVYEASVVFAADAALALLRGRFWSALAYTGSWTVMRGSRLWS